MNRELIALGTSSQVPTRERSQNAYFLRWDGEGFLFDPGEGTQRQFTLAGIAVSSIHHICITHFHGDHCLGLPGIVQRLSLDHCDHPVHIYYPKSGQAYLDRLCSASMYQREAEMVFHPITPSGDMLELNRSGESLLMAQSLDHSVPTIGFRVAEQPGIRFLPEKLEAFAIRGAAVGELKQRGFLQTGNGEVRLEDVTVPRAGSAFAFVMDTRACGGAVELAMNANLLIMEATYASEHQDLADYYAHATAGDAARTARSAGVHRLALTHFSQRYPDPEKHLEDARPVFPNVLALKDLDCIGIPRQD